MVYIYKCPEECARALRLIMEQMNKESESANALKTAIGYLEVLQMDCNKEKKERDERNAKHEREYKIRINRTSPIKVGDEIKVYEESEECGYFKAIVIDIDCDGALWILDQHGNNTIINPDDERKREKTGRCVDYVKDMIYEMKDGATE